MAEWKSLDVLICEYTEAQRRLEEAIGRNRAQAAESRNIVQRMRLDRACEIMRLELASLTRRIIEMQNIVKERENRERYQREQASHGRGTGRRAVWPDCDCPDGTHQT
ncbi:hypothetical protein [Butyricicoccus pullicaecorum]|uniref:Uncharacterized protein n=1 Tax=Butyricicoccus pullicaecorum 1.2 TaxID=1203606 RepID=R8W0B5_9FIRM|nr:hypothetical protein [Butyricicoccus pullicaecorum]EOQ37956.1 hypothetical protein HMPREF1526_00984 [Butyricicoccus pullicaecorum 1.2]SKA60737.1 hypothetical protein SAMN02745978_01964 [Butyricicoccus pullicaecorum DSM 23266]